MPCKSNRVRVKMCGMTSLIDVNYAIDSGADAIGFIFYQKSSRVVTPMQVNEILLGLRPFISTVGVMVDSTHQVVDEIIHLLPLHYLQFHGHESPQFCRQFAKPYIKAIAASSATAIIKAVEDFHDAAAILLDTPTEHYGGSGIPFDWQLIPQNLGKPIILAGGLTASNVQAAMASINPFAVDVCSGIESIPGKKDYQKINQFMQAVRA